MVDSFAMSVDQGSSNGNAMHTRLVVDAMLGSIARKLRFFGFDTLYYNGIEDSSLLDICIKESRVLVTMDEELHKRARRLGLRSILIEKANNKKSKDINTMEAILRALGVSYIEFNVNYSRCSLCNSSIECVNDKFNLKGLIHNNILNLYERFYICKGCRKVYWEGSHVKRLREFAKEVNARLGI
jgi:uncharacterized protein with PIN domain